MQTTVNNTHTKNTKIGKNVAVKYNGNQLDKLTNCLNYDFAVFNYKGLPDFTKLPGQITIEKMDYGTKVFKNVVNVKIDGEKFCGVVWEPRNNNIDKDLVQIKLENHILYNYPLEQTKSILQAFTKLIGLGKLGNLSRIDVCSDFENASDYMRQMIQDILTHKVKISGRTKKISLFNEVLNCYGSTSGGLLQYNGLSVGKKSNSRYLRIYNKSLEMHDVKYKHHIADFWKLNGFKDLSNVWRFEYSLNSTFIREYKITFDDFFNPANMLKILQTAYNNHFELRQNTGKKEINKEKAMYFFDFAKLRDKTTVYLAKVKKEIKETIQRSIVSVKRQIKGLYRSYYSTSCESFYDAMYLHLRNYDLLDWFDQKQEKYIQDFQKETIKLKML